MLLTGTWSELCLKVSVEQTPVKDGGDLEGYLTPREDFRRVPLAYLNISMVTSIMC